MLDGCMLNIHGLATNTHSEDNKSKEKLKFAGNRQPVKCDWMKQWQFISMRFYITNTAPNFPGINILPQILLFFLPAARFILNNLNICSDLFVSFCISYISLSWCIVESTGVKCVVRVLDDLWGVKDREDRAQGSSVPVICHAPSIVALSGHVPEGIERHILYSTEMIHFHVIREHNSRWAISSWILLYCKGLLGNLGFWHSCGHYGTMAAVVNQVIYQVDQSVAPTVYVSKWARYWTLSYPHWIHQCVCVWILDKKTFRYR